MSFFELGRNFLRMLWHQMGLWQCYNHHCAAFLSLVAHAVLFASWKFVPLNLGRIAHFPQASLIAFSGYASLPGMKWLLSNISLLFISRWHVVALQLSTSDLCKAWNYDWEASPNGHIQMYQSAWNPEFRWAPHFPAHPTSDVSGPCDGERRDEKLAPTQLGALGNRLGLFGGRTALVGKHGVEH